MSPKITPRGAVMGIGSLPHRGHVDALAFLFETTPAIPGWPQLPKRSPSEALIAQYLAGAPFAILGEPDQPAKWDETGSQLLEEWPGEAAEGFQPFCEAIATRRNQKPGWLFVKGQLLGPLTLARCFAFGDVLDSPHFAKRMDRLTDWLCDIARLQALALKAATAGATPVMLVIDEPSLQFVDWDRESASRRLRRLVEVLHEKGLLAGLHCCSSAPWHHILDLQFDLISLDANAHLETFLANREQIGAYIARGGMIAWGIVPTDGSGNPEAMAEKLRRAIEVLPASAWDQSLVTPTCGLGLSPIDVARRVLHRCGEVSRLVGKSHAKT